MLPGLPNSGIGKGLFEIGDDVFILAGMGKGVAEEDGAGPDIILSGR